LFDPFFHDARKVKRENPYFILLPVLAYVPLDSIQIKRTERAGAPPSETWDGGRAPLAE
jgi:hypothetical protein